MSVGKTDREEIEMLFPGHIHPFPRSPRPAKQNCLSRFHTSGRTPVQGLSYHAPSQTLPVLRLAFRGVLDKLNATLVTYRRSRRLHTILEDFIARNYDFGTAYAFLCLVWNAHSPSNELRRREEKDRERRQKALVGNRIVDIYLRPRRVWDLCSNRVVPSWITDKRPTPISHAWVVEKDRVDVRTPINGKEWPVPIPKAWISTSSGSMLNLGVEYAWLDVLCLRQKEEGGPREDLRVEEWRLDVPTIGGVYRTHLFHSILKKVVIYLSGLGRPLTLKGRRLGQRSELVSTCMDTPGGWI